MFQPAALSNVVPGRAGASGGGRRDRSRSPQRLNPQPPWSCGHPSVDAWFYKLGLDDDLLQDFCKVPYTERGKVMKAMQRLCSEDKLNSPGGYVFGTIRKHFQAKPDAEHGPPSVAPEYSAGHSPGGSASSPGRLQNTETADASSRRGHDEPAVPPAAVELAVLANRNTDMMMHFMTYVQPHHEAWFLELPAPVQFHVAWCFMMSAPTYARDQSDFMDRLMMRYNLLFPQTESVPRSLDTSGRSRVVIQLVLVGTVLPASMAIASALTSKLQAPVDDVDIVMKPAVVVQERIESKITAEDVRAAGLNVNVRVYDNPRLYAVDVRQTANQLKSENVKFVVVCSAASVVTGGPLCLPRFGPSDLHCSNYATFDTLQLIDTVRQHVGGDDVITEALLSPPPSGDWLSEIWGNPVELIIPRDWLPIRPVPHICAVPSNFRVAPTFVDSAGLTAPVNGQTRANVMTLPEKYHHGTLRGFGLARTMSDSQFQTMRMAVAEETCIIDSLRVDDTNNRRLLPNRDWWVRWMCLHPPTSTAIYNAAYPCLGEVRKVDGKQHRGASLGPSALTTCGHVRYCCNCDLVLKHLDRGFTEATTADTALAMITNCLGHWARKQGQQPLQWGRPTSELRQHECKKACEKV